MRADVLVPRTSHSLSIGHSTLYSYRVPDELEGVLCPGHLVAAPFGDDIAAAIVWALDASEDADAFDPAASDSRRQAPRSLRTLASLLLPYPLLLPTQRALAEWLADTYSAPLSTTARLMFPPGLLSGLRTVVRLTPRDASDITHDLCTGDEAVVLAMIRERGQIEQRQLEQTLSRNRARSILAALSERGAIRVTVELPDAQVGARHGRVARLAAEALALAAWRDSARARLDTLPSPPKRRASSPLDKAEREAERLLRQLAVLDVLERQAAGCGGPVWRVEDLRRLTRATESALGELEAAGLIALDDVELRHDPLAGRVIPRNDALALTPAQRDALDTILAAVRDEAARDGAPSEPDVFLLHGITGSGKTEIYLQALAAVIARGRRGIVLVPEIALTPQAMARFEGRFPGRVALLHSGLTDGERLDEWRRIRAGQVDVVVGSRSALFAPVDRLGLIVVDEEHETAYKQDRTPTYHARDAAVRLGRLAGAAVVLGSATPSVEAYWLATQGEYHLVELRERAPAGEPARAGDQPPVAALAAPTLPPVTLVDLRAELRGGNTSILSQPLQDAVAKTLANGEQAILFLNRRGMASSVVCRECGYAVRCSACDVSMTFHAGDRALICHYCGRREPAPSTCPMCWSAGIRYFGLGTERVELAVKRQFPQARVLRWDRDTARTRQAHEDLLRAFAERRADVLVGTQMIAKGLDLPGVTLVGVVSADVALFLPDFRASERAFQLLTQVAGRAGRGERPGRVLVQTLNPEHFCIEAAARHDYAAFFAAEVAARRRFGYPPFRRFVKFTYEHADRYSAQVEATVLAERLERHVTELALPETDLVGPAPAFMERLRGRYRWQLILRSPDPRPLLRGLSREDLPRGWSVDVDPATSL